MASINKVIIVGNLGRDPENRYLPSGEQVASIAVATTDRWHNKAWASRKNRPNGTVFPSSANWLKLQAST